MHPYNELVEKYSGQSGTVIAVGIEPSGVAHLGNLSTITMAAMLAKGIGDARVLLTVCDLNIPSKRIWHPKREGFIAYYGSLEDLGRCHESFLDHSVASVEDYVYALSEELNVPVDIQGFSSVQGREGYRVGLKRLLDTEGAIRVIKGSVPYDCVLVRPICNECGTSDYMYPRYDDGMLITSCSYPECYVEGYSVDVLDVSRELGVHFFLTPLRDKTVEPFADIHVFGGDYRFLHWGGSVRDIRQVLSLDEVRVPTKLDKAMGLTSVASGGAIPDYLVGPLFRNGKEDAMSKSEGNGFTFEDLQAALGDRGRIVRNLVELVKMSVELNVPVVEYDIIEFALLEMAVD